MILSGEKKKSRVLGQYFTGILLSSLLLFSCPPLLSYAGIAKEQIVEQPLPTLSPRQRWSEDWSVLNEPDRLDNDSWLPMKHITLNESGTNYLSLGGEYRLAYESYNPVGRGVTNSGNQDVLLNRLAIHADWQIASQWRLYGELGYASSYDREGGTTAVDESDVNVWQSFVDYRLTTGSNERLVFRLGRQFIETANVFITAGEANNVRLVYNAGRIVYQRDDDNLIEAFVAEYVDYADEAFEMSGTDEYFWGLRYTKDINHIGTDLSFLYLGWDLKDRNFEQGEGKSHDETRHQALLWLNQPLTAKNQIGLDYYLVYQFGTYDDQPGGSDIKAFAAFGEVKYAFLKASNTPFIGLKTSYFSGDDDPEDNEINTFYNPVFGTPYFSYARDIMPFNLIHIQPNVGYRFGDDLLVTLSDDVLWRASTKDAFYTGTNQIGVEAEESESRYIGTQAQLSAKWQVNNHITLSMYAVHFWAGDVVKDAGGENQTYFRLGMNFLF